MTRDYEAASKASAASDHARAITLLRTVVEDGKDRPIQVKARKLLEEIEKKAARDAEAAGDLALQGKKKEAVAAYTRLNRDFPGTLAARQGRQTLTKLVSKAEAPSDDRQRQAADLLNQAKQDYRGQRYLICLDRCEMLADGYADLPEAKEAGKLAEQIKDNPEWTRTACDQLGERLAVLYLALADSWLKKGKPQQAEFYLERVVKLFPGSRQAELAQARLARLRGAPETRK
jgi:tetratricopeptide (TPR) repeat protein